MRRRPLAIALGALLSVLPARAQVHGDIDLEAGAAARWLSSRPRPTGQPDVGPSLSLSGELAVVPLLRAGIYAWHDFSPLPGEDLRELTGIGASGRLFSPWPRGVVRLFLGVGLGYVFGFAPGYRATTEVPGKAGGYFEVPLSIGGVFRLSKRFDLLVEAGTRLGFGFTGSMYDPGSGHDTVAVFWSAGVGYEL